MGDRLATTDMGRKVAAFLCPFPCGSWVPILHNVAWPEAYLRTKWHLDPSNHFATVHQRYRKTGQRGQRSRSIGRTCNGRPTSRQVMLLDSPSLGVENLTKNLSSCDLELRPMTVTFELDPQGVKMNQQAKYVGQRSFSSKVIVRRHRHTDTRTGTRPIALPRPLVIGVHRVK